MASKRQIRRKRQREAEMIKRENLCIETLSNFQPRNDKQAFLYDALMSYPMVIAQGSAGSGKSYIGVDVALNKLCNKDVKKIYITRNPLSTGKSMGFFPGTPEGKMRVWCQPILNHISKKIGPVMMNSFLSNGKIELIPIEILKGMDFTRSFVILEEAQECSLEQLKMISTRIGKRSILFINGDIEQTNSNMRDGGFRIFSQAIEKENKYTEEQIELESELQPWEQLIIPVVKFDDNDCVRSFLCRKILDIFNTQDL